MLYLLLQQKTDEKYLGYMDTWIYKDTQLTRNFDKDNIKNKLVTLLVAIRNLASCIPRKLRFTIYNALAKLHLSYEIPDRKDVLLKQD